MSIQTVINNNIRPFNPSNPPPVGNASHASTTTDDRPRILYSEAGQFPAAVERAIDVLAANADNGPQVLRRGGQLVTVSRQPLPIVTSKRGGPKASGLMIKSVNARWLQHRLCQLAEWKKEFQSKATGEIYTRQINAPITVAEAIVAESGDLDPLPNLTGIIEAPTLRPDGSLLNRRGYDPASGLFYDPGPVKFPNAAATVDKTAALAALDTLRDLIKTFPFQCATDESVALVAILTALVRRSLPSAPMIGISATAPSSGKSLLADCIGLIATGRPPATLSLGDDEAEFRKRLLPLLAEGHQTILLDNISRPLDSDSLCIAITQAIYTDRVLGASQTVSVPTNALFISTGNNLRIGGDLTTRTLTIFLDAKCERPAARRFDRNLRAYIAEHRPAIVTAALTIMRAYAAQSERVQCPNFGRFEQWSAMCREPLLWLGLPDPIIALTTIERADPVRESLRAVLGCWFDLIGPDCPVLASELLQAVSNPDAIPGQAITGNAALDERLATASARTGTTFKDLCGGLHDALLNATSHARQQPPRLSSKAMGAYFARYENRIESGLFISTAGTRRHTRTWTLCTAEAAGAVEV